VAASQRAIDIATQVFEGAVDRTRVNSGELRASWNLSKGFPSFVVVGKADSSPGNTGTVLPKPTAPVFTPTIFGQKYFVTNGKTYAVFEEFGTATQTPQLMLTRAVQAVDL